MSRLHLFDMDGTLLEGSACLDLSVHAGHGEVVHGIEARWALGQVGHVEFYELCMPLWEGLTEADVDAVFAAGRWVDGLEDVFADIRRRGEHSAVVTLSPQFFAERLLRLGVESVHGAGVGAGGEVDPAVVLSPASKVTIAGSLLDRYGLEADDCVAYGDSASDIPLFAALRHTVAVNASAAVRELAATSYDGTDLRGAYAAGRALLERARC